MDLSFENVLYDNSLKKPKFSVPEKQEKERYPGLSLLQQTVKVKYKSQISISGNKLSKGSKKYTVRYNGNGQWAFGEVDDEVNIIFAISKDEKKENEYRMVVVKKDDMDKKSGSWSLSEEKRKDMKSGNIDTINKEIINSIGQV